MNNPQYVKVDGTLYKINTDFRVALECNSISRDKNIGDYERALAICYKLFGDSAFSCENKPRMFELGMQYLSLGNKEKPVKTNSDNKNELDFTKCTGLIKSSFKFDYQYDPYELEYLHWYDFYNDLLNLSTSSLKLAIIPYCFSPNSSLNLSYFFSIDFLFLSYHKVTTLFISFSSLISLQQLFVVIKSSIQYLKKLVP